MQVAKLNSQRIWFYQYFKSHLYWKDVLILLIFAAVGGLASYFGSQFINPVIFDKPTANVWFSSDLPRVFQSMTTRVIDRSNVHPLFSLVANPLVSMLKQGFGVDVANAVRIVIAAIASLWLSALFILLRLVGCYRLDSALFSLVGASSAAAMFWFVVPETFSLGSLSILVALCFTAIAQSRSISALWYVAITVLTLGFTLTNGMVGVLVTVIHRRWQQSLFIIFSALPIVGILWSVQKLFFSIFINPASLLNERIRLGFPESLTELFNSVHSFLLDTIVLLSIHAGERNWLTDYERLNWSYLTIKNTANTVSSSTVWGTIAISSWIALLSLGLWGFFSIKKHLKLRIVLGLTLLGQLLLHILLYENDLFRYSLHFAPLLVLLAAFSTLTQARRLALGLAAVLVVCGGVNNTLQLHQASTFLLAQGTTRDLVKTQMWLRPRDPWMRGDGHVVLAVPGTREADKAYHEPGGSFSPAVDSFGVSIWLVDQQGNLKATSDSIPLSQIQQQLFYSSGQKQPGILTQTNDYRSTWSSAGLGRWQLNLQTPSSTGTKPRLVVRSVGPAGGAIRSLKWSHQQLQINNRWSVKITPNPTGVYLGEEKQDWVHQRPSITTWEGRSGWGYAQFELGEGQEWTMTLEGPSQPPPELGVTSSRSNLELDLPEPRFADSLNAQVAHLVMSLVDKQARPGDPVSYPLPWQRDGAYTLVALAQAGQLEVAKQLSTYFAEKDFFGGFGPEADAPGLGIWALEEIAVRLNDPEYDQWLWSHVRRKADYILEMLSAQKPLHQPVTTPVLLGMEKDPEVTLVAEPARNGLVNGRMDLQRPSLFINAVSYRGLLDAAALADRVNQPAAALRWRTRAAELQKAWLKAFKPPESDNDRTYISSLWQSWTASDPKLLLGGLEKRWARLRKEQGDFHSTPLWTYFDLAEAHQWLFLGKPERVWATVNWFWEHQSSPGLYTWWEGEKNLSIAWSRIRGWVQPQPITPHYWTASEMLLLQLDMLAYVDRSAQPTLVIGAGIPTTWLKQPMSVKGLSMPDASVDWSWDGQQMSVQIRGRRINVKLGSAFPTNTRINLTYQ